MQRCRVVLVRPHIAANIGAAARVMRNMGAEQLVLVNPVASPQDRQARQLSTHGEAILDRCQIVADLGEAVADCVLVGATSARTGGLYRQRGGNHGPGWGTPAEMMPQLVNAMSRGPVALVFGPEPSGLSNSEIARCHLLLHIPTDPTYPALNLAQSIAICLYELRQSWLSQTNAPLPDVPVASFAEQERMFDHLRAALEHIHFLYGDKADSLMHALRHLIGRAQPTSGEVKILMGLARQLVWFASQNNQCPPSDKET